VVAATAYWIEVSSSISFGYRIIQQVSDTSFTVLDGCSPGMWYWHVSCSRNYSLFSPVDSVKIDPVATERYLARNVNSFFRIAKSKQGVFIFFGGYDRSEANASVYSSRGQLLLNLRASDFGSNNIFWDYKDKSGKTVPNGLYLMEIKAGAKIFNQKIMVTR
jgi:hypothetical protein